jgi:hypothetical protein
MDTVIATMKNRAIARKRLELRRKLWPDVKDEDLWCRTKKTGFTTIPRTMPLFMHIMDSMSKGKPISAVYLELWCRAFDDHVIELRDKTEMAFHSGFTGQRGVQTWSSRIDILNKLGFINVLPGAHGKQSYALLLNPYEVIRKHRTKKNTTISESAYTALVSRAHKIGATDLN